MILTTKLKALITKLERGIINFFVLAGYGGIEQTGTPAMSDIDSTFQTIAFNAGTLTSPRGVTQDFANDALIFDFEGIWRVAAQVTLSFVDINSGREMQIRYFNRDTLTAGPQVNYFVGRNQAGINIVFLLNVEILNVEVGDKFEIQVASATDTFTVVVNEGSRFEANHVSEFIGDLI